MRISDWSSDVCSSDLRGTMAKLARVIFRLDFKKTCTSLLNAPGTAFEVLESVEDDFWDKVSETVQKHVFTATYHVQDNIHRQLSVDPQNINGAIEYLSGGINLKDFQNDRCFAELDRLTIKLLEKFNAFELRRAGIRFLLVDTVPEGTSGVLSKLCAQYPTKIVEKIRKELGEVDDLAGLFQGKGKDEIHYILRFGPLFDKDTDKLFSDGRVSDVKLFTDQGFNIMCDIDLYERDISFREFTLSKWSRTKIRKAEAFLAQLSRSIAT